MTTGVARARSAAVHAVFFASGAAALVYQVVWERVLFAEFGVDSASVAVDVAAFMVGLGVGSLLGGALSRKLPGATLALFAAFELVIGAYGAASVPLFRAVGAALPSLGHAGSGAVAFALVLVPTTAMGATLPLLVAASARRTHDVGRSVASLYFANTLGAALGAWLSAAELLARYGLVGASRTAAATNIALGVTLLILASLARVRPA